MQQQPSHPSRRRLLTSSGMRVMVRQVTGVLARRIVCDLQLADYVEAGQRYGMIKFGSRTELYLPLSVAPAPLVKVGDTVRGGETLIARVASVEHPAHVPQGSVNPPQQASHADPQIQPAI